MSIQSTKTIKQESVPVHNKANLYAQTRRAGTMPSKPFARNSLVPIYSYSTMRRKGVRLCSSVVERLTCNQEVLSSILSGGSFFADAGGSRAVRPPARARGRARVVRRGRREATLGRGEARDASGRCLTTGVEAVFSVFDELATEAALAIFRVRRTIVGAKHHGTVRGAHRERAPRTGDDDGVAVDRRSPEGGRSAGGPRAGVSALRCVPHRARASRHLRRADRRPTDDPLPRRRRPERHDGVHQRADSQRGVVTGYVALLSPAKRDATPRASPGGPLLSGSRGRGVPVSIVTRSRRDVCSTRRT